MRALVLGEFKQPKRLLAAVTRLRQDGFEALDTYTPYPVHGTSQALGLPRSRVALLALLGALTGATTAYVCQYLMVAWDYPLNVGAAPRTRCRPSSPSPSSWPSSSPPSPSSSA